MCCPVFSPHIRGGAEIRWKYQKSINDKLLAYSPCALGVDTEKKSKYKKINNKILDPAFNNVKLKEW